MGNFSVRLDDELLERIDRNAQRCGMNRTTYVLSWLPEVTDIRREFRRSTTQTHADDDAENDR